MSQRSEVTMGRPPRSKEGKAKQITLRLRPSLRYGLELLSRDQHCSMSQAVEFALDAAFRGYLMGHGMSLSSLLSRIPADANEGLKALICYEYSPALLDPLDRFGAQVVYQSKEMSDLTETALRDSEYDEQKKMLLSWAGENWSSIVGVANALQLSGFPLSGISIESLLKIKSEFGQYTADQVRTLAKRAKGRNRE